MADLGLSREYSPHFLGGFPISKGQSGILFVGVIRMMPTGSAPAEPPHEFLSMASQ